MNFQIPASKVSDFKKIINKYSVNIKGIEYTIGDPYKRVYKHVGSDHKPYKFVYTVCDVNLEWPKEKDWKIIAEIKDCSMFIFDKNHEFKNGHGMNYRHCDACGRTITTGSFVIENTKTNEELQLGIECAKKYGVNSLKFIDKLISELYGNYIFSECSSTDCDEKEPCGWRPNMSCERAYETTYVISVAKYIYDNNDGNWIKGQTLNKINKEFDYVEENIEYANELIEYISKNYTSNDNEFNNGIVDLSKNKYSTVFDATYAFFAIKNYEQSKKPRLELKEGDTIQLKGEFKLIGCFDGWYGPYYKYYIINEIDGNKYFKEGSQMKNTKVDNMYSTIKKIDKSGDIYLNRITKNKKK